MSLPRNKRRAMVIIALAMPVLYFGFPFPFLSENSRADIREAGIRYLVHHNDSAVQHKLEVCYVGLGTSFDPEDNDFAPQAPPAAFLKRFEDFQVPVYGVGATDGAGKRGLSLSAGNVRRWSLGLVRCRGLYFEGSLSSAAYDIYILRVPFAWLPVGARMLWLS